MGTKGQSLTPEDVVAGTASGDTDFLASVMAKLVRAPSASRQQGAPGAHGTGPSTFPTLAATL